MSVKHPQHIICIPSRKVAHRKNNGFVNYTLKNEDIIIAQRNFLEQTTEYRQYLPLSIFICNGKVWAYRRTEKGGEDKLHGKVSVIVGGHWDLSDIVYNEETSVIDLEKSIKKTFDRELEEEVKLESKIVRSYEIEEKICADDTETDQKHMCSITIHELNGEELESNEDQLETLGFFNPSDLLDGDYELETWARIACEYLTKNN